jgi:hypothetical protein
MSHLDGIHGKEKQRERKGSPKASRKGKQSLTAPLYWHYQSLASFHESRKQQRGLAIFPLERKAFPFQKKAFQSLLEEAPIDQKPALMPVLFPRHSLLAFGKLEKANVKAWTSGRFYAFAAEGGFLLSKIFQLRP